MNNNLLNKKLLYGVILLLFAILFLFLIFDGYFELDRDIRIYSAEAVDIIDQRITSLLFEVNVFPQFAGDDLIFLSKLSSFKKVAYSTEDSNVNLVDLENDFLAFLKESTAYYQLGYIDGQGNEIVKVEYDRKNYMVITKEHLGNEKDEFYFTEAFNFDYKDFYISRISLNVKDEEIENRGTIENPEYVPIVLVATPVFDENKKKMGVVFLSFYADYFLADIRNFQREGEEIFLINEGGDYLAHSNREKEFAFIFGGDENIYKDYPEITQEILFDYYERRFETSDLIFSFRYLYPTIGGFRVNEFSENTFGRNPEESNFWVLVSVSDKSVIDNTVKELKSKYLYFLLFSGLIVFIIILLIFVAVFKGFDSKSFREKK
ncbi:MAG: cache domain-containing protein [Nanoarchaeota archaeon]|nr:cache domain-containing protein [Nanoarchaeota archaeon]